MGSPCASSKIHDGVFFNVLLRFGHAYRFDAWLLTLKCISLKFCKTFILGKGDVSLEPFPTDCNFHFQFAGLFLIYNAIRSNSSLFRMIWSWNRVCHANVMPCRRVSLMTADLNCPIICDRRPQRLARRCISVSTFCSSRGCRIATALQLLRRKTTIKCIWLGITVKMGISTSVWIFGICFTHCWVYSPMAVSLGTPFCMFPKIQ